MSKLKDHKKKVLDQYSSAHMDIACMSEILTVLKFLKTLYKLLDTGKMYNGFSEDMSYVNILNGGDLSEIKTLEEYLNLKTTIDRNRGYYEYLDKIVDHVQKSDSIEAVDKLMEQVYGDGTE